MNTDKLTITIPTEVAVTDAQRRLLVTLASGHAHETLETASAPHWMDSQTAIVRAGLVEFRRYANTSEYITGMTTSGWEYVIDNAVVPLDVLATRMFAAGRRRLNVATAWSTDRANGPKASAHDASVYAAEAAEWFRLAARAEKVHKATPATVPA